MEILHLLLLTEFILILQIRYNFTSNITSELGDLDSQSFSFNMNCMTFSPNVSVALLTLDCDSLK